MTSAEVLHALVDKTLEQFKSKRLKLRWKDDNVVEIYQGKKPLTRVRVENYSFYSIADLVLAIYDAFYDSRKEVALIEKEEIRDPDSFKLEGHKKLRELTIYHSTGDEDFYAEIDKESFEGTICHDEMTKVLLFIKDAEK